MVSCFLCVGTRELLPFDMWIDLLQISTLFCTSCLCDVPALVYRVPFDLSHASTEVDWTDVCVKLGPFNISMVQKPISLKPPMGCQARIMGRYRRMSPAGAQLQTQGHAAQDSPEAGIHIQAGRAQDRLEALEL